MKKILLILGLCLGSLHVAHGGMDVDIRSEGYIVAISSVAVSSTTVTAIPVTALSGAFKIILQNKDVSWDVSIGTFSTFTYGTGFILTDTTEDNPAVLTLPMSSGMQLYALAESTGPATVGLRIIQIK